LHDWNIMLNRARSITRLFSTSASPVAPVAPVAPSINPKRINYKHPIPAHAKWSVLTDEPILQDKFGRFHNYLRVSLTEHCSFNCVYCVYDQDIDYTPKNKLLTEDELLRMIKLLVSAGVTKIRLTGGEPTIYKGLPRLIEEVGGIVKTLGMTTNGFMLHKKLEDYKKQGLNALNISLDSFNEAKSEMISRTKGHSFVMKSIYKAIDLGYAPLKINCVMMKGVNDDELLDFVAFAKEYNVNIRFIEFFSIGNNGWSKDKMVSFSEMKSRIEEKFGPMIPIPMEFGDTAKNFNLTDFKGSVSFITSVTQPFCAKCNRIRLLSNGMFRRCLHDDRMLDLKDLLNKQASDEAILEYMSSFIKRKEAAHAGMDIISKLQKDGLQMIKIGG
jgi:cyclic pyranopterin phosphate synthase